MNFPDTKSTTEIHVLGQESQETKTNDIILRRHLNPKGSIRSGGDPIIAELEGKTVFVTFLRDVDILNVTITGAQGTVYHSSIDTTSPSTLTIPLVDFPSGSYTIVFSNQNGTMEGDFTL